MYWVCEMLMVFCTFESQASVEHHNRHIHDLIKGLHLEHLSSLLDLLSQQTSGSHVSASSQEHAQSCQWTWLVELSLSSARPVSESSAPSCSAGSSTILSVYASRQGLRCTCAWNRWTATAESASSVWTVDASRCATTGLSYSQHCSGAASVESSQCSAETCTEDETVESSERFCFEELDLVLVLMLIVSRVRRSVVLYFCVDSFRRLCLLLAVLFSPAVGPLFSPAVGPLFFIHCGSALSVLINRRLLLTACSCSSCAILTALQEPSVMTLRGFLAEVHPPCEGNASVPALVLRAIARDNCRSVLLAALRTDCATSRRGRFVKLSQALSASVPGVLPAKTSSRSIVCTWGLSCDYWPWAGGRSALLDLSRVCMIDRAAWPVESYCSSPCLCCFGTGTPASCPRAPKASAMLWVWQLFRTLCSLPPPRASRGEVTCALSLCTVAPSARSWPEVLLVVRILSARQRPAVRHSPEVLELLLSESQTLLVWWNAFIVLGLGLHVVNGVKSSISTRIPSPSFASASKASSDGELHAPSSHAPTCDGQWLSP